MHARFTLCSTIRMLTPWDWYKGIWFKREDLFRPLGDEHVNGTKLRQFHHVLCEASARGGLESKKIIVQTSVHSTSGAICAAVARQMNPDWKVTVVVGGLKEHHIPNHPMLRLARYYGAEIRVVCGTGMSGPVMARLREISAAEGHFNACLEDQLRHNPDFVLQSVAKQVQNIPPQIKRIYVPVGSGTQMAGIITGLNKLPQRQDMQVIGLNVGPKRDIASMISMFSDVDYIQIELNTQYSKPCHVSIDGIGALDTCYEAKAFQWMQGQGHLFQPTHALWLVGCKLTSSEVDALNDSSLVTQNATY